MARSRTPWIVSDTAWAILTRDPGAVPGNFFINEEALREEGTTDFSVYLHDGGSGSSGEADLELDLFLGS